MSSDAWVKLLLAAGAAVLGVKAMGGPNKRPTVDGMPVYRNGNGPAADPGDRGGPAYCGVGLEAKAC